MIIVLGEVLARPEHREAATALGLEHCERSRAEPGCLSHDCYVDAKAPDRLRFVEVWQDMSALREHFSVPSSALFVKRLAALLQEPPQMRIFEASEISLQGAKPD